MATSGRRPKAKARSATAHSTPAPATAPSATAASTSALQFLVTDTVSLQIYPAGQLSPDGLREMALRILALNVFSAPAAVSVRDRGGFLPAGESCTPPLLQPSETEKLLRIRAAQYLLTLFPGSDEPAKG